MAFSTAASNFSQGQKASIPAFYICGPRGAVEVFVGSEWKQSEVGLEECKDCGSRTSQAALKANQAPAWLDQRFLLRSWRNWSLFEAQGICRSTLGRCPPTFTDTLHTLVDMMALNPYPVSSHAEKMHIRCI